MNAPTLERHLRSEPAGEKPPRAQDLAQVVELLLGTDGLDIRDRQHNLRRYRSCFIGSELIDLLTDRYAISREAALGLAQRLETSGYIRHVVGRHSIKDEHLFYRLNRVLSAPVQQGHMDRQQLAEIVQAMRAPSGLAYGVRYRWFVRYSDCFAGHEAVDWISAYCEVSRQDATRIGQQLLRGNFIRHLFDEHDFSDKPYLYRFV